MIRLEPFGPNDFQQLINWIDTEELLIKWSGSLFSFPLTTESLQWYITNTNVINESDAFVYKAVDAATGEVVGHISLGGLSWKNRSSRISRVLVAPGHQQKGYCQQITKAVLKIGFEELGLHRIALGVYENNKSAINCYLKSGLNIEGVSRDILWYNHEFLSMVEMAILEGEWRALNLNAGQ
jgi:RimJ/RimL family protein N-acetyltransferase